MSKSSTGHGLGWETALLLQRFEASPLPDRDLSRSEVDEQVAAWSVLGIGEYSTDHDSVRWAIVSLSDGYSI